MGRPCMAAYINAGCLRDCAMDELPDDIGQGTPGVIKLPGAFCDKAVTVTQTIAGRLWAHVSVHIHTHVRVCARPERRR